MKCIRASAGVFKDMDIEPGRRLMLIRGKYGPGRYYVVSQAVYFLYYALGAVFFSFIILCVACNNLFAVFGMFVMPTIVLGLLALSFAMGKPVPEQNITQAQRDATRMTPRRVFFFVALFALCVFGGRTLMERVPIRDNHVRQVVCEICQVACGISVPKVKKE
jgi:hypothetical protein